ncbi:hypothetical protein GCM10027034_19210 [Ramlibacter solisilvae]|uniref:Uncharacterized protein n=1 Tax=Ramlibacter tataouinensis TaxID=94132 RepID=A0A127JVP8_9BURK|nr:hypothetical protein [Ramlibacter tataouinensis]AMO23975.1 hypothetical protein UC35_15285 [Ramlibacter tataouinensis]
MLPVAPACAPRAAAVALSRVEPPGALPPEAPLAPMAVEPVDGAPMATLPGVVGPDIVLLPAVVPAGAVATLEPDAPATPGSEPPIAPLLPGVLALPAICGSQGMAPGAVPGAVLEV